MAEPVLKVLAGMGALFLAVVLKEVRKKHLGEAFEELKRVCTLEVDGPLDNFGVVAEIAPDVEPVFAPGSGRYLVKEKKVLLSYPQGSRQLLALLEAAHEAGHALHRVRAIDWMYDPRLKNSAYLLLTLAALAFVLLWPGNRTAACAALLSPLLVLYSLFVAVRAYEELKAVFFSFRWLSSYLNGLGLDRKEFRTLVCVLRAKTAMEAAFVVINGLACLSFALGLYLLLLAGLELDLYLRGGV
ncbi:hypothetical protein Adeg_0735 [Ammonifex degensii KC4]|uniref:Uncharacterized protein n=1 Tax=Ammonifex degensii (strain DSM 10501 / KC4) TaxID=429009 RepID=C9RCA4_AMMDK|nr:hypothetical protein [Ammonifex degensii]ACX51881.1 hypothetical protein Adeg_0735 [Ammonifex degensii KC4]